MTKRVPKPGDIVYITPDDLDFADEGHIDTAAVVVKDEEGALRYVFINSTPAATFWGDDKVAQEVKSSAIASIIDITDDADWSWSQAEAIRKQADSDEKWYLEQLDRVKKARELADRLEGEDSA